jgi:hypothetical protein
MAFLTVTYDTQVATIQHTTASAATTTAATLRSNWNTARWQPPIKTSSKQTMGLINCVFSAKGRWKEPLPAITTTTRTRQLEENVTQLKSIKAIGAKPIGPKTGPMRNPK